MQKSESFLKIVERIKQIKRLHSDTDVSKLLGMSVTALANRKYRDSIPYQEIISFCEEENISMAWLLTGKEPMQKGLNNQTEEAPPEAQSPTQQLIMEMVIGLSPERQKTILRIVIEQEELQRKEEYQRGLTKKESAVHQ